MFRKCLMAIAIFFAGRDVLLADSITNINDNFDITCAGQQCVVNIDVTLLGSGSYSVEFQRPLGNNMWSTVANNGFTTTDPCSKSVNLPMPQLPSSITWTGCILIVRRDGAEVDKKSKGTLRGT